MKDELGLEPKARRLALSFAHPTPCINIYVPLIEKEHWKVDLILKIREIWIFSLHLLCLC